VILGRATSAAIPETDEAHDRFLIVDANELTPFYPLGNDLTDELGHADSGGFRLPFQRTMLRRRKIDLSTNHMNDIIVMSR